MAAICVYPPPRSSRRRCDYRDALTRFHSRSPPAISVLDYLKRILRYIPRIEVGILLLPSRHPRTFHPLEIRNSRTCLSARSYSSCFTTSTGSVLIFHILLFHHSPSTVSSLRVSPLHRKPSATPLPPTRNLLVSAVSASSNSTSLRRNFLRSLIGVWL